LPSVYSETGLDGGNPIITLMYGCREIWVIHFAKRYRTLRFWLLSCSYNAGGGALN